MTPSEIKLIAQQLNINKPILRTELVDKRLMIYLYGGEVVEYTTANTEPALSQQLADADVIANPEMYSREQLRGVAARLGIEGAEDTNKRPLVKAIKEWKQDNH